MIAIDWGSSSLRGYRLDGEGRVLERRRGDDGALASAGRHGKVLAAIIAGWDDPLVLMAGMVGARGGWIEVPYVRCPADLATLAAGMQRLDASRESPALAQRALWCVPGMADRSMPAGDVMRGEETRSPAWSTRSATAPTPCACRAPTASGCRCAMARSCIFPPR